MNYFRCLFAIAAFVTTFSVHAEKVFQYSEDGSPTSFDPPQCSNVYASDIVTAVYDTLYEYRYLKRPYELKPSLATDMPVVSKDGLTYTIKLKQGVMFQDDPCFPAGKGREVVADDFVYSMRRHFVAADSSQGEWLWAGKLVGLDDWKKSGSDWKKPVEGLKALDKYTIQIKLVKPYPQLIWTLAMAYSAVVPNEAVEKYGREFAIKPVGSGPWKLKSHNSKKTVLVRNPTYREEIFNASAEGYDESIHGATGIKKLDGKKLPIVDVIETNWMKEQVARWNSFSKGNEVMWTVLQNEQLDEVLASRSPVKLKPAFASKYNFRTSEEDGLVFTFFNMDMPEIGYSKDPAQNTRNRALRCAIRKSYDWNKRIERFYLGMGEAYPGFITKNVYDYDPKLSRESVTLDIEGAKKLLKDNGWTPENLPVLEYSSVASVRDQQFFELFRGGLAEIGYPAAKVKNQTFATFGDFSKAQKTRKLMLIPMGWGLDYPDAENTLALFYGPNSSPGANTSNYGNPEYDALFDKASTMLQGPARKEIYKKLNQILIDDCATISSFSRTRVFLWHKNAVIWPQREMIGNVYKYLDVL